MQREDFRWFVENYNDLFKKYGEAFLAIRNKQVIGAFQTMRAALDEVSKQLPLGDFIVQHCNGSASAYTNYVASAGFITI